ncbi:MAG: hypothetical protein J0H68_05100 [Sphingobacteriia bacterium]|nr:hypothetical protein [Sphingobacteriia bacterium]
MSKSSEEKVQVESTGDKTPSTGNSIPSLHIVDILPEHQTQVAQLRGEMRANNSLEKDEKIARELQDKLEKESLNNNTNEPKETKTKKIKLIKEEKSEEGSEEKTEKISPDIKGIKTSNNNIINNASNFVGTVINTAGTAASEKKEKKKVNKETKKENEDVIIDVNKIDFGDIGEGLTQTPSTIDPFRFDDLNYRQNNDNSKDQKRNAKRCYSLSQRLESDVIGSIMRYAKNFKSEAFMWMNKWRKADKKINQITISNDNPFDNTENIEERLNNNLLLPNLSQTVIESKERAAEALKQYGVISLKLAKSLKQKRSAKLKFIGNIALITVSFGGSIVMEVYGAGYLATRIIAHTSTFLATLVGGQGTQNAYKELGKADKSAVGNFFDEDEGLPETIKDILDKNLSNNNAENREEQNIATANDIAIAVKNRKTRPQLAVPKLKDIGQWGSTFSMGATTFRSSSDTVKSVYSPRQDNISRFNALSNFNNANRWLTTFEILEILREYNSKITVHLSANLAESNKSEETLVNGYKENSTVLIIQTIKANYIKEENYRELAKPEINGPVGTYYAGILLHNKTIYLINPRGEKTDHTANILKSFNELKKHLPNVITLIKDNDKPQVIYNQGADSGFYLIQNIMDIVEGNYNGKSVSSLAKSEDISKIRDNFQKNFGHIINNNSPRREK